MEDNMGRMRVEYIEIRDTLTRIEEKIGNHYVLKEVYRRDVEDYSDLVIKYDEKIVSYAVELVNMYKMLLILQKKIKG